MIKAFIPDFIKDTLTFVENDIVRRGQWEPMALVESRATSWPLWLIWLMETIYRST